jgi:hypothetical protein
MRSSSKKLELSPVGTTASAKAFAKADISFITYVGVEKSIFLDW